MFKKIRKLREMTLEWKVGKGDHTWFVYLDTKTRFENMRENKVG